MATFRNWSDLYGPAEHSPVGEIRPERQLPDRPVKIQAKVTADKATTIRYHWESAPALSAGAENPVAERKIPKGDTIIETTVDLSNRTGLTQTFVIDSSNDDTEGDHSYTLTCR